jgi:Tfp pilus assembly protein FimT
MVFPGRAWEQVCISIQNPKSKIQNIPPSSFIPHPSSFVLHSSSVINPGFTLFEVLLTLCLLVAMAAMVWPSLDKTFANQRLLKAADQIRTQWCKARLDAMSSSSTLAFCYETDGVRYRILGSSADTNASQTGTETQSTSNYTTNTALIQKENISQTDDQALGNSFSPIKNLPYGISFFGSQSVVDDRASAAASNPASTDSNWSQPFFFYPDGTTSSAVLLLRNKDGRVIELTLRGLTGVVKVSDIKTAEGIATP